MCLNLLFSSSSAENVRRFFIVSLLQKVEGSHLNTLSEIWGPSQSNVPENDFLDAVQRTGVATFSDFFSEKLTVFVLLAKELFDIFAKTRLEYIRPPTLNILFDIGVGVLGIFLGPKTGYSRSTKH